MENLWTLKALLRGFELVLDLKVNFHESCLISVNVAPKVMRTTCNFLNCRQGSIPFLYLGLPVGANPRRVETWEPMVEQLRRRIISWGNRYVSLGGCIVLLNLVLNSIPIFYLSLLKMSSKVVNSVVALQRNFPIHTNKQAVNQTITRG